MADKKKKKNDGKKEGKKERKKSEASTPKRSASKPAKAVSQAKAIAQNPLVAEVVSAALIATAAALRDPKKARQLAEGSGDQITKLGAEGSEKGSALWTLALDVGKRALEALADEQPKKRKTAAKKG